MSAAREEVLHRIRLANTRAGATNVEKKTPNETALHHDSSTTVVAGDVETFVERTADYKAVVERTTSADLAARVTAALDGANGVLLPDGLPNTVAQAVDPGLVRVDPGSADGLDAIEAVVTTCAAAIAETGTIVLDHSAGQGRRALTLVSDLHVCLVRASQIHAGVAECVRAVRPSVEAGRVLTWISGPSATSDIELDRVEGVHGARRLHVIVITDA